MKKIYTASAIILLFISVTLLYSSGMMEKCYAQGFLHGVIGSFYRTIEAFSPSSRPGTYRDITALKLKMSPNDIRFISDPGSSDNWRNISLLLGDNTLPAKIRKPDPANPDFQIIVSKKAYNMFKADETNIFYYLLVKALQHDDDILTTSDPKLVSLYINNIYSGIYILEDKTYPGIRDVSGNYYFSFRDDLIMKRIILFHIDKKRLPSAIIFFDISKLYRLLSLCELFEFDKYNAMSGILFQFDAGTNTLTPYLTVGGLLNMDKIDPSKSRAYTHTSGSEYDTIKYFVDFLMRSGHTRTKYIKALLFMSSKRGLLPYIDKEIYTLLPLIESQDSGFKSKKERMLATKKYLKRVKTNYTSVKTNLIRSLRSFGDTSTPPRTAETFQGT